jgi:hypothetical protein
MPIDVGGHDISLTAIQKKQFAMKTCFRGRQQAVNCAGIADRNIQGLIVILEMHQRDS